MRGRAVELRSREELHPLVQGALWSLTPVGELRAGIPIALALGADVIPAYLVCVAANVTIIPIIFLFLNTIHRGLMHVGPYERLFDRFIERTRRKVFPYVEKYGLIGLCLFVAIPLPVTGAWTGTFGAWLLGIPLRRSAAPLSAGVAIAGVVVSVVFLAGGQLLRAVFLG